MTERDVRERDILVAANEFAYVQDLTKGDIVLYVGPTKISLSNTERLVDFRHDRFLPVRADDPSSGVSPFVRATQGEYIVLENPAKSPEARAIKGSNAAVELLHGRKVVIAGPATFALWPGQRARVIGGHALREDEYLVVRAYDADAAGLAIGQEQVIRGADHAFYVPATGFEVVPVDGGGFVRRAFLLRKNCGLHLRVLRPHEVREGDLLPPGRYEAGREVFLRDHEGYVFPAEWLEIVGVSSPVGLSEREGLYVRDRLTGAIATVAGPASYLVDPTREEVVTRDRAITVDVPPSTAVMVVSPRRREVVVGPALRVLGYDEELEVLSLSTGRPKSAAQPLETCFLQIAGNKVSDVVPVRTRDHVELEVSLSYRVSFTDAGGRPERWFSVRDYVALLCDHMGSILRAAAREVPVERLHAEATPLVRAAILGDKRPGEARAGRVFEENGMCVYDVEVLDVRILDDEVRALLAAAQRSAIAGEIEKTRLANAAGVEDAREAARRSHIAARLETLAHEEALAEREAAAARAAQEAKLAREERDALARAEREARALSIAREAEAGARDRELAQERARLEAQTTAFAAQMSALAPELVATLKTLGHERLAADLTKHLGPLSILGGESVADVAERLIGSLPVGAGARVADVLPPARPENGRAKRA